MANQIVVSAGAKVRNLGGVLTATSGVVSSLPINASNGIPQLDVNGKILVSQLPNSVMEYLGVWNAATNTPTLANGTGNQGDVYLCNVAGTVDFGAGPIVFFVGDQVIYSGSIWQRASGATGTVTSVAITESGDSLNITGSPITTSGTINIGFNGTNLQYVNGAGNLTTFPTLTGYVPYSGATANVNLGEYGLSGGFIGFDTTPTSTPTAQGTMYWSADKESVDVIMNGVTGSVMQDTFYNVKNQTGATITKGTIVRANGTVGASGRILIAPFLADGSYDSKVCLGVTAETILNGEDGKVTAFGAIRQIDTSAFANGTILYASPTTAGGFTSTEPTNPSNIVTIAIVVYSDVNNGEIFVRPTFVDNAADIAASLGYTPANDALVVHLAGTETITGAKTFTATSLTLAPTSGGGTLNLKQDAFLGATNGYTSLTSSGSDFAIIAATGVSTSKQAVFSLSSLGSTLRTYTLPDASGTLALTSDIPSLAGYVTLGTTQTITGAKTFSAYTTFTSTVDITSGLTFSNSGFTLVLQPPTLSVNRTVTFPNATGTLALTSDISYPVTSVFGRTGAVVATSGDYTTAQVTEVTNLYYTDTRARLALSFVAGSGAYNNTTGVITIPTNNNQITNGAGYITGNQTITLSGDVSGSGTTAITTTIGALKVTNAMLAGSIDLTTKVTGLLPDGNISSAATWNAKQDTITLTTTGTSGAATFTSNTLNIPNYGSALSGYLPLTGGTLTGALNGTSAVFTGSVTSKGLYVNGITDYDFYVGTSANSINFGYNNNDALATWINQYGYQNGDTQFRTLNIGDGKNGTIAQFNGSTSSSVFYGTGAFTGALSGTSASFSSTSFTNLTVNGTNANGWGNNIAFQSGGTDFGYIGSTGSLLGNTTKDMTIWATAGNGFRVYTNGNNLRAIIDTSGNLGLGVTPSAWQTDVKAIQIGDVGSNICANNAAYSGGNNVWINNNSFQNSSVQDIYTRTATAGQYQIQGNAHIWRIAPSGTAGNAITFTQAMTLFANGGLGLNTTTPTVSTGYQTFSINGSTGGQIEFQTSGAGKAFIYSNSTDLRFYTNGGAYRFENTTGLEVGYSSAIGLYKLDVNGTGRFSGNLRIDKATPLLVLNDTSGSGAQIGSFGGNLNLIDNATGTKGLVISLSTGAATFSSSVGIGTGATIANDITWTNNIGYGLLAQDGTRFVAYTTAGGLSLGYAAAKTIIQGSGGNVGIGTTSPSDILTIETTNNILTQRGGTGYSIYRSYAGDGTTANLVEFQIRNRVDGSNMVSLGTYSNHDLTFRTNNTERMRITSGGQVSIGPSGTVYGTNLLNVNGGIYATSSVAAVVAADLDMMVFQNTGATYTKSCLVASMTATGGTGSYFFYGQQSTSTAAIKIFSNGNIQNTNNSYGAISDARLKENIKDATPKLDDLMKVKVRNYNLKGESNKQLGVISQELEAIFPNMIEESTNMGENMKIKGVKYSVFVPMLIKAVQEQQQQINELKQLLNK